MAEQRPLLVTTERKSLLPLLIIDKTGLLGTGLTEKIHEQFLVVLVTPTISEELSAKKNVIHIPYRKKIPLIPDNIYSHVFLFYSGENELIDMLPSFTRKANESAGKLFFITSLFHSNQSLIKHLSHHAYHHLRVLLYGEIFDNELKEENLLNYFIFQARVNGRIEVPNNGLGKLYPVHIDDVLSALIAVAFAHERPSKILLAFPKHEISELSVARMLQKLHPHLKVDYKKSKRKPPNYYIPQEGAYCFPNYNVEVRLHDIDMSTHAIPRGERVQIKRIMHKKKKRRISPVLLTTILVVYFIILPLMLTGGFTVAGLWALQQALKEAEGAHLEAANKYVSAAHFSFSSANTLTDSMVYLEPIAADQKREVSRQLAVGKQMAEITRDMLDAAEIMQRINAGMSTQPKQDFLHALATTKNSLLTLQKLKAEKALPARIAAKVEALDDVIGLLESTGDTLPTVLGFDGKKTYLVLFQNNMELRPGGGFIGSFGVLNIENGKTDKLQIHDVYDADGQLTTHVEPPYGLRRYLGAAHWYLRDSNFDPDFTKNAQTAANFLQLETKEKVDGVIAVDTAFLQKLLKAFGPVTVHDYNETVTAENFYMLTQTHAEKDFFPGSTQKKDFLRALFNAILLRLEEKKQISYPLLADSIIESLKGKHLLLTFSDTGVQDAFTVNNLSGALWDARSSGEGAVLDFLGVIDANLGTNKVNYYVKRSIDQRTSMQQSGEVQTSVSVTYDNTSKKDSPFGGDYKNYVRYVIPKNAVVRSIAVDNKAVPITAAITDPAEFTRAGFLPPQEMEVEQSEAAGKRVVGFLQIVPVGTRKTVTLTYTVARAFDPNKPAVVYKHRVFKQPGAADDPFTLSVTYPQNYTFLAEQQQNEGVDVGGKVNYQTTLNEDKDVSLLFTKK